MKRVNQQTLTVFTSFFKHRGSSLNTCRYIGSGLNSSPIISSSNFRLFSDTSVCLGKPLVSKAAVVDVSSVEVSDSESPSKSSDQNPVEGGLDNRIAVAGDAETLLELSTAKGLGLRQKCLIVYHLGQTVEKSEGGGEKILGDPRFVGLCTALENANFNQFPQHLLQAIHGLVSLGVPGDHLTMKSLENQLKWDVRRCPIRYVSKAIALLSSIHGDALKITKVDPANTKLNSSHPLVVAINSLQRRWLEVTSGTDFISTFQVMGFLNKDVRSKLEDRALEVVQGFSPMEMIKIFIALGNQKRRPTPLLRALAFHLSKSKDTLEPKDLIELLYALNELSFADPVLMGKVCNELSPAIGSINSSSLISSLVTSLGQLRYKHKELTAALEDWIMKNLETLRPFDYAAWLMTSSVLNIQSEHTDTFCTQAKQVLSENRPNNPAKWLNVVHALATLKQLDSSLISTVLAPDFVAQIDAAGLKASGAKLKLLNINAASKSLKNYQGPRLPDEVVKDWTPTVVSTDEKLSQTVLETLRNFLPPPKYLKGSEKHHTGVFVDAFCTLNEKLDPIPVDTASKYPGKVINVAIVAHGYLTQTLGLREPTGLSALQVRLLQNEGYYVVTVPYTEFSPQEKVLRRVQYLEQRMRSINIQSDSESS